MESLYRKYRPQTFDDVVGQRHVVETLARAVEEGRMSHAYLFCGPRGTGKTTMARLLAKALLCRQGAGRLPDGTCEECRLVAEGAHPDVFELDAASRTGVDNVREEIINRVGYAAVRGAYKVYVIDEVHMLTTQSFNALLKTLEEPPSHVVFVLCTTDPQKIPATILSRVQRFEFHAISAADIEARLRAVCDREGFDAEPEALALIARHARGGLRDALSTLEQLSVFGSGAITTAGAQDMLGEVASSTLGDVAQALARRDVASLFSEVATLVDAGRDLLRFVRELSAHLRDVYVCAAVGPDAGLVSAGASSVDVLADEAALFGSADRVARALAVLSDAATEMRYAPDQRLVLEVALTRLARPESDVTLDSLAERLAELERRLDAAPVTQAPAAAPIAPSAPAKASPAATTPPKPAAPAKAEAPAPPRVAPEATPKPQTAKPAPAATPKPVAPAPSPKPEPAPYATPAAPSTPVSAMTSAATPEPGLAGTPAEGISDPKLEALWEKAVAVTLAEQPARGQLLSKASIVEDDGATLVISFPPGQSFAYSMLGRRDVLDLIEPLVSKVFGQRSIRCTKQKAPAGGVSPQGRGPAPQKEKPVAPKREPQRKTAEPSPVKTTATPPDEALAVPTVQLPSRDELAARQTTPFPMPWDPPEKEAEFRQEPQDVVVPYEEEMTSYEDDYVPTDAYFDAPSQQVPDDDPMLETAGAPSPARQAVTEAPVPTAPAPVQTPVPQETPARPPEPRPEPEPEPKPEPEPEPEPEPDARPKRAAKPKEPAGPSKQDREIEAALALLTGVFGPGVNAERIASDEVEPADYLSEDGGFAEDLGPDAYAEENFED